MSRSIILFLALFTIFSAASSGASAQGLAARTVPNRDGLYLQGGAWFVGNADSRPWFRAEVGIHLARLTRADLYLQIPVMITHRGYNGYGYTGFAVVPGVKGEWTLFNRKGDLSVTLEGGLGLFMWAWSGRAGCGAGVACDGYSDIWLISRVAAGVTYTAPFGLMVSFTPFGGGGIFGNGGGGYYDGSLLIGYRWQ